MLSNLDFTRLIQNRTLWGKIFILFIASLVVRLAILWLFSSHNAAEGWDAIQYFNRAIGFKTILSDLFQGSLPSRNDLSQAYSLTWPPIQSLVLGLGLLVFGSDLDGARLTMVMVSAFTTPLVYIVTHKLAGNRAATAASIVFILYPTFIHFSLRLFSETTYIFFVFLTLYFVLKAVDLTQSDKKIAVYTCLSGFFMALATLTRAAGLIWIPTIALWLAWRSVGKKRRLLLPLLMMLSAGITILPWEIAVFAVEDRVAIITNTSDYNLYKGNSPVRELDKDAQKEFAQQYSERQGISLNEAYRDLALQTIIGDPLGFIKRGFSKWQKLWSIDHMFFVYIWSATYPPLEVSTVITISLAVIISYFVFIALAVRGLFGQAPAMRHRELIIALLLTAMLTHFITIASTRFNVPLQAILLPAVGYGLINWRVQKERIYRLSTAVTLITTALIWTSIYTTLRDRYSGLTSSSYYASLNTTIYPWLGTYSGNSDRLLFRAVGDNFLDDVTLTITNRNYTFTMVHPNFLAAGKPEKTNLSAVEPHTYRWRPTSTEILNVVIQSTNATEPMQLNLSSQQTAQSETLKLTKMAWQTWQATSLPGIEYMWVAASALKPAAVKIVLKNKGLIEDKKSPQSGD